jgi:alanyl-tRNA synthetase
MLYIESMENLFYYTDPYCREIDAKVADVQDITEQQAHQLSVSLGKVPHDVCAVLFSTTIFYPEGGGQPGDRGTVTIGGHSFEIIDTHKKHNNVIHKGQEAGDERDSDGGLGIVPVHFVACSKNLIHAGDEAHLVLDWDHRYAFMQLHTAQHLLSGLMFSKLGIGTVSVHLGVDNLTVEVSEPEINESDMLLIEDAANDAVLSGLNVSCSFLSHSEAEALHMRRSIKVDTDVRVVRIADLDAIACGGMHVKCTSECRIVLYQGQEKIRGNIRTIWKAGTAAMDQIHADHDIVRRLCALQSARPEELFGISDALQKSLVQERAEKSRLSLMLAKSLIDARIAGKASSCAFVLDSEMDLKSFASAAEGYDNLALAAVKKDSGKILWLVVLKGRYDKIQFSEVRSRLLGPLGAKGGGRSPLFQGMAAECTDESIAEFLRGFEAMAGEA